VWAIATGEQMFGDESLELAERRQLLAQARLLLGQEPQ
jgi:hypothetical protein